MVVVVVVVQSLMLGCLGPDTELHSLAPVSRMVQTWSLLL